MHEAGWLLKLDADGLKLVFLLKDWEEKKTNKKGPQMATLSGNHIEIDQNPKTIISQYGHKQAQWEV